MKTSHLDLAAPRQTHIRKRRASAALLLATLGCAGLASGASNITWKAGVTGDWSTGTNWNGNIVPGVADSGDQAFLTTSGGNASVTTTVPNVSGILVNNFSQVTVNTGGTLSVVGGNGLFLGQSVGSSGTMTLAGGTVTSDSETDIGRGGDGVLTQNSGTLGVTGGLYLGNIGGSTGNYTLNGGTTTTDLLSVGGGGSGTIHQHGGTMNATSQIFIGANSIAGTYTIDQTVGAASLTSNQILIGYGANTGSQLTISAGSVSTADLQLANGGTNATLSLSGGTLTLTGTGNTSIGVGVTGTMNQSGGTWSAKAVTVGQLSGSTGTYNLSLAGSATMTSLTVGANASATGNVTIADSSSLSSTGEADIGLNGSGTVTQSGGTVTIPTLYIGKNAGSTGSYSVSAGSVTVGGGDINISRGSMTVSGSGSLSSTGGNILNVGFANGGTGTMNQTGGTVTAPFTFIGVGAGTSATAVGVYNLSGTGALIANSEMDIGRFASGTMNQSGGSVTANGGIFLGNNFNGTGTYNISAGTVSTAALIVGSSRDGTVTQTGGTITVSGDVQLASGSATHSGTYNLNGGTVSSNRFFAGLSGPGHLTLGGGTLTTNELRVDQGASPLLTFNSGTINTKATTVINGAAFVVGDGTGIAVLNLDGGTHTFSNGLVISANGYLKGTGTTSANVTVNANGTVAAGASPGILHLGNLTLNPDAIDSVDLNGTTVGTQYDQLDITGTVSLDQSHIAPVLGYAPTAGDKFFVIKNDLSDAITGRFAFMPDGGMGYVMFSGNPYSFQISYFGDTTSGNTTGGNDVVLTSLGAGQQGVNLAPEPGSMTILLTGAGMMIRRRRRRFEIRPLA